jgi:hypothetical protein
MNDPLNHTKQHERAIGFFVLFRVSSWIVT